MDSNQSVRMLKVDLSKRTCHTEEIPARILKNYVGGRGLGSYLLYNLVPARPTLWKGQPSDLHGRPLTARISSIPPRRT